MEHSTRRDLRCGHRHSARPHWESRCSGPSANLICSYMKASFRGAAFCLNHTGASLTASSQGKVVSPATREVLTCCGHFVVGGFVPFSLVLLAVNRWSVGRCCAT